MRVPVRVCVSVHDCKLLYKHELAKQWGSHCRCCAFCFSIARSVVSARHAGKVEEFCSERCRNKFALLTQQVPGAGGGLGGAGRGLGGVWCVAWGTAGG